jgi:hypothetical protein
VWVPRRSRCLDAATNASTVQPVRPWAGACEREAPKLVGKEAVRVGGQIRAPRKLRDVSPSYPKLPPGTVGSGSWVGELLIDAQGKVARVWTIREPRLTPAYPPFTKAGSSRDDRGARSVVYATDLRNAPG